MNLYVVLSHAIVLAIFLIQNQFIKQVAAKNEPAAAAGRWFHNLEKRLNDMMHKVIQGAIVASNWTEMEHKQPKKEVTRLSYVVDENKVYPEPVLHQWIRDNKDLSEKLSEERSESYQVVNAKPITHHNHTKKKKAIKSKKKHKLQKPRRLLEDSKEGVKKFTKQHTSNKKIKTKVYTVSERAYTDNSDKKTKPVNIVVHIKMAE